MATEKQDSARLTHLTLLDRAGLHAELERCGLAWTEAQQRAAWDMGLLPTVGAPDSRRVPACAVSLLQPTILVADARALAEARGRASLVARALFDGDESAANGVRAWLRQRLLEDAVLGQLAEILPMLSQEVCETLRGDARREWHLRGLLAALRHVEVDTGTGTTGRHAVPHVELPDEPVRPTVPRVAGGALDGVDSTATIPVPAPGRPRPAPPAPAPPARSPSTMPIPRAPDAHEVARVGATDERAIPEALRYAQGSVEERESILSELLDRGREAGLESALENGHADVLDAFRIHVGDRLSARPGRESEALAYWERVAARSSAHTAEALTRLAHAAILQGAWESACAHVEALAVEARDADLLAQTVDDLVEAMNRAEAPGAEALLLRLLRLRVLTPEQTTQLRELLQASADLEAWIEVVRVEAAGLFDPDQSVSFWTARIDEAEQVFHDAVAASRLAREAMDACGPTPAVVERLLAFTSRTADLPGQRLALDHLADADDPPTALKALADRATLEVSLGNDPGAIQALERILDRVPPSGAGAERVHQPVMDALASVDRPDLQLRWLKRRAASAPGPVESYAWWVEIVTTLHGLPGYAGELATAIDMALTLSSEADVEPSEVMRLHALGLAAKAQAPRWESAAWHAAQVMERREPMDTETASLLLDAVERAGAAVGTSAEALGILLDLAGHAHELDDARIVSGIGHGLVRAHEWDAARRVLERLVQREPAVLPQEVKARAYADLARAYEHLHAAGSGE